LAAALGAGPGLGAPADVDPWWYYSETGIAEVVEAGFDGRGLTVAVLDGWIDTSAPVFADADIEVRSFCGYPEGVEGLESGTSTSGVLSPGEIPTGEAGAEVLTALEHGTNVTARLVGNGALVGGVKGPVGVAPKAKILHYVVAGNVDADPDVARCAGTGATGPYGEDKAVLAAIEAGADVITSSMGISFSSAAEEIQAGEVIAVRPSGNDMDHYLRGASPQPGVAKVRGFKADGELPEWLVFSDPETAVVGPGTQDGAGLVPVAGGGWEAAVVAGNSYVAPVVAGLLADLAVKYPEASKAQLVQSLVRNTWDFDHEPSWDDYWGWGAVDVPRLFAADPSQYPDVNPLLGEMGVLTTEPPAPPSPSESESAPSPSASASSSPTGGEAASDPGSVAWLPFVVVGGGVVALAAVVVVAVAARRAQTRKAPPTWTQY
jgi:hypothetical protein